MASMQVAAQVMWEQDCGCVPITDGEDHLVGIVTDRDIAMAAYTQGLPLGAMPISLAMSSKVISVQAEDDIDSAETLMQQHKVRRLPVLGQDERLVGILSINDLALATTRGRGKSPGVSRSDVANTLAAISEHRREEDCEPAATPKLALESTSRVAVRA